MLHSSGNVYAFPDRELLAVFTAALVPEQADTLLDELVRSYLLPAVR